MKYLFFFLVVTLIISCGHPFINKQEKIKLESYNSDTLILLKKFKNKFKILTLPFCANTSCYEPDSASSLRLYPPDDSLFAKYSEVAVTIGLLPDTTNFYAFIFCRAAECYLPILLVISKDGKRLNEEPISNGCGADCGYKCSDSLVIKSMSDIVLTNITESYECDSLGNETPGTWEKKVDVSMFSIDKYGKIKKTNSHTSERK
jgi:hypothetical protein